MTDDFFCSRLDQTIDISHPLAVLASRLPCEKMQVGVASEFAHQLHPIKQSEEVPDLVRPDFKFNGGKASNAGRPRLSTRLMIALTLPEGSVDLCDKELVLRFAENVYWQYFVGFEYFDPRHPCDGTQIGRFCVTLGAAGLEELLSATIQTAVDVGDIKKKEFKRVVLYTTVQEKTIAYSVDSRWLEIARREVVAAATRFDIVLKQTFPAEGNTLQRQAGGYARAKQFKRLRRVIKRERTLLGILIRQARRKMASTAENELALTSLNTWLERAECVRTQQRQDKNRLYALHAPEVKCIGEGKARKSDEFGVKVSVTLTHKQGFLMGARKFTGNPYDGHIQSAQWKQSTILLQDLDVRPKQVLVDLGFRGKDVNQAISALEIINRGRIKSMTQIQRSWLEQRQAMQPAIRAPQVSQPHAASLAAGCRGRCVARAVLRRRLQPALADEGGGASGPQGLLLFQFGLAYLGRFAAKGMPKLRICIHVSALNSGFNPQQRPARL